MKSVLMTMLIGGAVMVMGSNVDAGMLKSPSLTLPSLYQSAAAMEMTVSATTANLRNQPSTKGQILAKLKHGTKVMVLGTSGTWTHVKVNNQEGYISSPLLR
jgi:uncharacterized protein YgiM (DUF1202 family)